MLKSRTKSVIYSLFIFGFFIFSRVEAQNQSILEIPGKKEFCKINEKGISIIPSGRFLSPAGDLVRITNKPFGLCISPDGRKAVTLHNGVFTIIDLTDLHSIRIPSYDGKIKSPLNQGSFLGVSFAEDSKTLYLSGGDNGAVIIYDSERLVKMDSISLNGKINGIEYNDSFTADLILNSVKHELLVLDRGNFRLVRIDLKTRKITNSIPSGRQPFGLALSPDLNTAFIANVGSYSYPLIEGSTPKNADSIMISHHPYGDNTPESINGTSVEGRKIPGLGNPNSPEGMSVFTVDLQSNLISDKFKTGYQIGQMIDGEEVVGGASPNSLVAGSTFAYVTNASNDNIGVIDFKNHRLLKSIPIQVDPLLDRYRGYLPFGLCITKDEKTLYVALLGLNAVAVIDIPSKKTLGLIPTGWGAARVRLSENEKELYITSARGLGAGPNGGKGFIDPPQGTYIGDIQLGSFQKVLVPSPIQLAEYTKQVINNTFITKNLRSIPTTNNLNPLPDLPEIYLKANNASSSIISSGFNKTTSPIQYIVYITKENRTFDEVFGQMKGVLGDSSLSRFGINCEYTLPDATRHQFKNLRVSPNHHKIAEEFSFSDNFYCDSDASIHGHHWMLGVVPNEWVEANSNVNRTAKIFSGAPGRRFPGTSGSMDPEDYAEKGGLWEALARKNIAFYNFGEANETAHNRELWTDTATGAGHIVMVPMQKVLFPRTSLNYAGFNTDIPDQFRMDQFEAEFTKKWIKGKEPMPSLITMQVPNDHTADPRIKDGYPYTSSFVADNDLALGRILHFLSRTRYWKNMLVIVTEDDPQGGVDHVDAHRSILMMAGPYIKRGYISHTHANFGSILKTIYNILGVPYVNQYDATASLLTDFFTPKPNYSPYTFERSDPRIFDPQKAMTRYNKTIDWRKIEKGPEMDDEERERANHYKNKVKE